MLGDQICQKLASASEKVCIGKLRKDVADRRRLSCRTFLDPMGLMFSPNPEGGAAEFEFG